MLNREKSTRTMTAFILGEHENSTDNPVGDALSAFDNIFSEFETDIKTIQNIAMAQYSKDQQTIDSLREIIYIKDKDTEENKQRKRIAELESLLEQRDRVLVLLTVERVLNER